MQIEAAKILCCATFIDFTLYGNEFFTYLDGTVWFGTNELHLQVYYTPF